MGKKRKYMVVGDVTISVHTEVEATSAAEAIRLAQERGMQSFCHQCSTGDPENEWTCSGELDGEPSGFRVEE
jgi:hypothetical protein